MRAYFSEADSVALYRLSEKGIFSRLTFANDQGRESVISLESLYQLVEEIRGGYRPQISKGLQLGIIKQIGFEEDIQRLVTFMEREQLSYLSQTELLEITGDILDQRRKDGTVGEFYEITTNSGRYVLTAMVHKNTQSQIDRAFRVRPPTESELSLKELTLFRSNRLNLDEIAELRALRSATKIFENATILKNTNAGGAINNARAEFNLGRQLKCVDEYCTYRNFVKTLNERGLLNHFDAAGSAHRKFPVITGGHMALILKSKRNAEQFVLDSWIESGGNAAHITAEEDWRWGRDFEDAASLPK